ncbi:hypothetical protein HGM15179_011500 [Zosterops borbonicus]|uniref:Uncharacterized protein n=1 Tax=Zosterops borbonicus TaxID=364589 RepID=A0A8K1GBF2_9PASS|nr:hypothetical protein HGM15179_011500 [Zosterops borbonicus]
MGRRRGGGAAPAEACGVWLDTAELKRGPARPFSAKLKAPTRIAERKQSLVLLPRPGTRQSTIPTFFRPHTGPAQPLRELFSQDSQGNRVIAHRERDRDSSLRDRDSQQLELGSECLFTQDSEGNRVIKHW